MTAYPALLAYIASRNACEGHWTDKLREDERAAQSGAFADVVAELEQAQEDYAAKQRATRPGANVFPYNSAMAEFLALPVKSNGEPGHGYYMATMILAHYRLGVAERALQSMIAEGKPLLIATARDKRTRKPVRFARFAGPEQIKLEGGTIALQNGKRAGRLSSNWSAETCYQLAAAAMRAGTAYGERA